MTNKFLGDAGTQVLVDEIKKNRKLLKIAYAELVELRDSGALSPGTFYHITDYTCTTTQSSTQSAGHDFDIIVQALSNNMLSEKAEAIAKNSDEYFANSKLSAWQIWYDLDNDITKYLWADTVNGKGVIYRMIDEFGNDCPYDFKNIQFKRYWTDGNELPNGEIILQGYFAHDTNTNMFSEGVDMNNAIWCYTFNFVEDSTDHTVNKDASINPSIIRANIIPDSDYHASEPCANNIIKQNWATQIIDDSTSYAVLSLNNIVFLNSPDEGSGPAIGNDETTAKTEMSHGNTFAEYNFDMTFGANCYFNSFGNYCDSNSFGNNCDSNSFGNYCDSNSFGNNCDSNSFGNYCYSNSFGNYCDSNSFGNYCDSNSFGNNCRSNSFGNNCDSNSFGNYCYSNSFGNYCDSNSFGNGILQNDIKYDFVSEVRFDDGVSYVNLKPSFVPSLNQYLCNIRVLRGVHGATRRKRSNGSYSWSNTQNRLNIVIDTFSQDYEILVGMSAAGEPKVWPNEPNDEITISEVEK